MQGFGCEVQLYDPYPNPELERLGMRYVAIDELLAGSDIVSLHCPLTPYTRHLIGERELALMKPGALLINVGRGGLVDEQALLEALGNRRLGGAGFDVASVEPPPSLQRASAAILLRLPVLQ